MHSSVHKVVVSEMSPAKMQVAVNLGIEDQREAKHQLEVLGTSHAELEGMVCLWGP